MLTIKLEGGFVTGVYSDDPALIGKEVVVMDMDAEGADDYVTDEVGRECCPRIEKVAEAATEEPAKDLALAKKRYGMPSRR